MSLWPPFTTMTTSTGFRPRKATAATLRVVRQTTISTATSASAAKTGRTGGRRAVTVLRSTRRRGDADEDRTVDRRAMRPAGLTRGRTDRGGSRRACGRTGCAVHRHHAAVHRVRPQVVGGTRRRGDRGGDAIAIATPPVRCRAGAPMLEHDQQAGNECDPEHDETETTEWRGAAGPRGRPPSPREEPHARRGTGGALARCRPTRATLIAQPEPEMTQGTAGGAAGRRRTPCTVATGGTGHAGSARPGNQRDGILAVPRSSCGRRVEEQHRRMRGQRLEEGSRAPGVASASRCGPFVRPAVLPVTKSVLTMRPRARDRTASRPRARCPTR